MTLLATPFPFLFYPILVQNPDEESANSFGVPDAVPHEHESHFSDLHAKHHQCSQQAEKPERESGSQTTELDDVGLVEIFWLRVRAFGDEFLNHSACKQLTDLLVDSLEQKVVARHRDSDVARGKLLLKESVGFNVIPRHILQLVTVNEQG